MLKNNIPWQWIIVALVVVLVLAYVAGRWLGKNKLSNRDLLDQTKKEIDPKKRSFPASQYSAFAEKAFSALYGAGTDSAAMFDIMQQMKTRDDVLSLVDAFGQRKSQEAWFGMAGGQMLTLPQWISEDMSASEIAKINNILSGKNINYRF